jgi:uncharacterized membrane protein
MPTTKPHEQHKDAERHMREAQNALIEEQVVHTLGKPDGLHELQVRRLWEDHYRVNVFIGTDGVSAKIANSYFVQADSDGNILRSSPKITKLY